MGVGIIFLVLHLPRTLLALYEVTRIPRILTCMVHGCRQGSLYPPFTLYLVSESMKQYKIQNRSQKILNLVYL